MRFTRNCRRAISCVLKLLPGTKRQDGILIFHSIPDFPFFFFSIVPWSITSIDYILRRNIFIQLGFLKMKSKERIASLIVFAELLNSSKLYLKVSRFPDKATLRAGRSFSTGALPLFVFVVLRYQ